MTEMTSRERLLAAIDGKPVDRIPVSPRIWRYARWKGLSKPELAKKFGYDYFGFGGGALGNALMDPYCEGVKPLLDNVKIDISTEREDQKTTARRTFHTPGGVLRDVIVKPDPGGEYGIAPNHEWIEPLLKNAADVELLPYLLPNPKFVKNGFAAMHELEDQVGDDGLVAYRPTLGVDQVVVDALGPVQAMMASIENPKMFARTVELVEKWHSETMKLVLEDGWQIIFDAFFNFSLSVGWSPDFYRDTVVPLIKSHTDLVHSYGAKMMFYDDGKVAMNIGQIIDAGVDIIQTLTPPPCGDLDHQWLAETHGGKTCFNGGMDTVKLRFGTPDEIESDVKKLMETLGSTGKFILGTSDSITEDTPEENMLAYFETARKYGK